MSKVLISSSSRYSIYKVHAALSQTALIDYHIFLSLSRTFFKFFQSFSEVLVFCVARSNFAMLAHPTPFVKYFFQVFPNFITGYSLSAAPCGQLAYTSTRIPFCQVLFRLFSKNMGYLSAPHINRHISLLLVIDQTVAAVLPAVNDGEGSAVIFIPEGEEIMLQQIHL